MERLKQAGSINTGRGGPLGTRVFGQELTNLKDLLRIGKEVLTYFTSELGLVEAEIYN
jgi:hypothetical protein